jgi:hypothetical protein
MGGLTLTTTRWFGKPFGTRFGPLGPIYFPVSFGDISGAEQHLERSAPYVRTSFRFRARPPPL